MNDSDTLQSMLDVDRLIHEPARLIILSILYVLESADFLYLLRAVSYTHLTLPTILLV